MRFLHLITSVDPRGGGPIEGVLRLHEALVGLGHGSELLSLDDPAAEFVRDCPAPVHALGPSSTGYHYNPNVVDWLREHASGYDAVIVNGLWQYTGFAAWRALSQSVTPYFVYTHGMLDPWFKRRYPLKHLKKWLYWPWGEYRVLRDAAAVIFTCEEERVLARQSFWLYRAREVVGSYGTSSPPSNARELTGTFLSAFPELKDKRLLLYLGRVHEKKGGDLLVEAFARVLDGNPELRLVMAGPGEEALVQQLKSRAEQLGIASHITWTGMLAGDMKWGAFYAADAFCLPSHQENFGIAVVEALACGKPVLISDKVNIWREIAEDGAGLVGNDTLEDTVDTLQRWLALPRPEVAAMRIAALRCFQYRFQVGQVAETLVQIIGDHSPGASRFGPLQGPQGAPSQRHHIV
ncbi:glycosyltransferase [Variovorax sp. J22R24]|uniref:glycosyltransferase n=1 Tax=Variovorax gracilis TaxID=3053502 RepID=UPI002577D5EC|nr:glycosyltransferase [Variovorax sp. J22R24]MDM0104788.1 glycosyltransferase [Variovorax sp. J22R24]